MPNIDFFPSIETTTESTILSHSPAPRTASPTPTESYQCGDCCYKTYSATCYSTHITLHRKHTAKGLLSCTVCGHNHGDLDSLLGHMSCHRSTRPVRLYSCQYCSVTSPFFTNSTDSIEGHIDEEHPEEEGDYRTLKYTLGKGKCPWCKWKCESDGTEETKVYGHILNIHGRSVSESYMMEEPIPPVQHTSTPPAPVLQTYSPTMGKEIGTISTSLFTPATLFDDRGQALTSMLNSIIKRETVVEDFSPMNSPATHDCPPPTIPSTDENTDPIGEDDMAGSFFCAYCSFRTHLQMKLESHLRQHPQAAVAGVTIYVCATCYEWGSTSATKVNEHSIQKHNVVQTDDVCSVIDISGQCKITMHV